MVASAVGGLLDLVVDGETGLLVPPRNVGRCGPRSSGCSAMPSLRRADGRGRAASACREHFTWPAVTDLTIQAYEDALAG